MWQHFHRNAHWYAAGAIAAFIAAALLGAWSVVFTVAAWAALLVAAFSTAVVAFDRFWPPRLRVGDDAHRCEKCGYDLRASRERCPECGTAIPASKVIG